MNKITYPCLMQRVQGSVTVVCFSSPGIGYVVSAINSILKVGYWCDDWNMNEFEPYIQTTEPIYYYQWANQADDEELIRISPYITNNYAFLHNFEEEDWTKILSSKTTWEELIS